jgi:hypothetical protein
MNLSSPIYYLVLLGLSQYPILENPQPIFLPRCEGPSFIPVQNIGKIIVLYILIFIFLGTSL